MIQENLWYFGEIFCKMYFFWPGRCRHYIIFYDKKNKLYGPFLWIGFNCLKARATLNLPLEATSRTCCSPLFYSKVALTLALVHSKYTRNKAIVIIRIQWWMNYLLLSYPVFLPDVALWKQLYLTLSCSEKFLENSQEKVPGLYFSLWL